MQLKMSVSPPRCSILMSIELNWTKQAKHFENNNITEIIIYL